MTELGWAFQQQIFDGVIEPISGVHKDITCPYGLYNRMFPGPTTRVPRLELRSPAATGMTDVVFFAVSMDYVKSLFTEAFWDRQVHQYGLASLSANQQAVVFFGLRPEFHERWYFSRPYLDPMDQDEVDAGVVPYTY